MRAWRKELDVDRAIYSIQVDGLSGARTSRKVAYYAAAARCAPDAASNGRARRRHDSHQLLERDPLLTFGVSSARCCSAPARWRWRDQSRPLGGEGGRPRRVAASAPQAPKEGGARTRKPGRPEGSGRRGRRRLAAARLAGAPLLYGVSGEYAGVELELSDEPVVLGRDPRVSQLVFCADTPGVSGRHCSIRFDPGRQTVLVEDLWSTHGTFLESGEAARRAASRTPLRSADQFYLADPDVLFEVRY